MRDRSGDEVVQRIDPAYRTYLSYIDRTREYYRALGYDKPYRYAFSDRVPFARPAQPLAESTVALVTTAVPVGTPVEDSSGKRIRSEVWSLPSEPPPERLYTDHVSWDKRATHTEDLDSFFPIHRLFELQDRGQIGAVAGRVHGVPTEYSQRLTRDEDAPELLRRLREDGADAALLVPL